MHTAYLLTRLPVLCLCVGAHRLRACVLTVPVSVYLSACVSLKPLTMVGQAAEPPRPAPIINRRRCETSPCFRGVRCVDTEEGFRCGACPRGYYGDGIRCERYTTCADNPCFQGGWVEKKWMCSGAVCVCLFVCLCVCVCVCLCVCVCVRA